MQPNLLLRVIGESNRILIVDYYVLSLYSDGYLEFQIMYDLSDPLSIKISWKEQLKTREMNKICKKIKEKLNVKPKKKRCKQPHHGYEIWLGSNFYTSSNDKKNSRFFQMV
jgi:hypothetical protein